MLAVTVDITTLYIVFILGIIVIIVGAYVMIYMSIMNAYRDVLLSISKEYDKALNLYANLYLLYLKILERYINATVSNGLQASLPPPPSITIPNMPVSISVSLPTQVSIPIPSSWPQVPTS